MIQSFFTKFTAGFTALMLALGGFTALPMHTVADEAVGFVRVSTNHPDGAYAIYPIAQNTPVGFGSGIASTLHVLDASAFPGTGYRIEFDDTVNGYTKPDTIYFNLATDDDKIFQGVYEDMNQVFGTGTVRVNTNHPDGEYNIYPIAGSESVGSGQGIAPTTHVLDASPEPGTGYKIEFGQVDGFEKPSTIYFNLVSGANLEFGPQYDSPFYAGDYNAQAGVLRVYTNLPNGSYTIYQASDLNGDVVLGSGSGITPTTHVLDASANPGTGYKIVFDFVDPYITPPTVYLNLISGQNVTVGPNEAPPYYGGEYTQGTGETGSVEVTQTGAQIGTVTLSGPGLTEVISGASYLNNVAPAGIYTISIAPPAGYAIDQVTDADGNAVAAPYGQILAANGSIAYNVSYRVIGSGNAGTVIVNQVGAIGTVQLSGPSPATVSTATYSNIVALVGSYTLTTIAPPAGFDLVNVTDSAGNVLTAPYAQALTATGNITYNVNYTPQGQGTISLTKTVDVAQIQSGSYATYTIRVARTDSDASRSISLNLTDTMTGSKLIRGANGGQMVHALNTTVCTPTGAAAYGPCELETSPLNVTLPNPDSALTITYRAQAQNSGVPVNTNSTATNTVSTLFDGQTISSSAAVAIMGLRSGGGGGGGTVSHSGGGGGGGGYRMIRGDMELLVEKQVSIDGVNFHDASSQDLAIVIPENRSTRLYNKVKITNIGEVTAQKVKYDHFFDVGNSDITADAVEDLEGATLKSGNIVIDKIKANDSVTFRYSIMLHEHGQNPNPALDGIELVDFDSGLSTVQDGLTYLGVGDRFVSYIFAGQVPGPIINPIVPSSAFSNESDVLQMTLLMDKAQANIGEIVNYTLTLENVSDVDLNNLFVTHTYPTELVVNTTGGGRDNGRGIQWQRPILRRGQKITFQFSMKVVAGSEGSQVWSTSSALVNEFEGIPPVESYLTIGSGTPIQPDRGYNLANTGPMGILMLFILSLLSSLGYQSFQKRRTQKLKIN